jgi:pimeloyl-ACP methyl ester carboxylesterase
MMEMPPLQFAHANGVRLAFYDAGPRDDSTPFVLCHGWPEIAFTWRRQIKGLSEAGFRAIAFDQRGYGASGCPPEVEAYAIDRLTGDVIGLLDHLGIGKAIVTGHDGYVVWETALRYPDRVAGVVSLNTPHVKRAPVDPISILRARFGEAMYIVQFQSSREPDRILAENVEKVFDAFLRGPLAPGKGAGSAGPGADQDFIAFVQAYDPAHDSRPPIMSEEERQVFVEAFRRSGFTGGINWYRNITQNWENAAGRDRTVRAPALMITAELDPTQLPPSGMDALVPNLTTHLVHGCGHWTQEEKPEEVSATIVAWRRRVLGR